LAHNAWAIFLETPHRLASHSTDCSGKQLLNVSELAQGHPDLLESFSHHANSVIVGDSGSPTVD